MAEEGDQEVVKMSENWGSSTTEKCCKCKSGSVGWSASGRCSFCHGAVSNTASVAPECTKKSPKFMGNSMCAKACRSKVESSSWSWMQEQSEEEEEAVAEEGDQEVVKMSENWGSSTTEKCCKCKSGSVGWSASGRCSFCHGSVSNTASVAPECTKKSPKFMGNSMCAKACRSKVESSSWSWMQEQSEEEEEAVAEEGDQEVVKMFENWGSSTTEKCCKCKSGSVGWSASGRCSFCHGSVSNTASVAPECTKKSPKFMGNSMCAKACRSKVESSSWSWMQEQSEEEEEAVAEEGDQEVVKMSENWGSSTTEKCCKCKSGSVGWSASGRCSFCHGSVSNTASVAPECTKKSPKFMGNSMCAKACRSKVESSSWSWMQEQSEEEEEAVAEEGDQEVVKMSENWGSSTTEKCCKCKSGSVGWSASGRCSFCHGSVSNTASVAPECTKKSPKFMGNSMCAKACRSKVESSSWSWMQEQSEEEEEAVAEEGDQEVVKMSENWGSSTTEKCCKCKSGSVGWSASGRCSFCHGSVSNTASVAPECTKKSPKFMGNSMCAKACRSKVESSSWSWMQEQSEEEEEAVAEEGDQEVVKMTKNLVSNATNATKFVNTTEQCCKCKSGSFGWSKAGTCSFCKGFIANSGPVDSECTANSTEFLGKSKCAKACKAKLQTGWSWLQQQSEEEEAVAEEGDQEVVKMSENWGSSTTEKCCKCKSGSVGWSASGRCSFCHGSVSNTASVAPECTKKSPKFMGNSMCAKACRSKVESSSWSWMQEQSEEEEEAVAEEGDEEVVKMTKNLVSNATNATKFVNTTEQCCKCKSGSFGWSKAGTCSFCKGFIANSGPVDSECTANSTEFLGKSKCAKACKAKLQTGWSWLQQQSEEEEAVAEEGDQEVVKMSENWGSSTTEKCCKCKSGSVGWSASGRCSFCHGSVSNTASVAPECTKKSPKFMGNSMCAKACRSKVESSSWSWMQEQSEEEEEAVAEEGDEEVVKMTKNLVSNATNATKFVNTTEQCCKCKSGSFGWSKAGTCSFCKGFIANSGPVDSECTANSTEFLGKSKCAKACKAKLQTGWSWLQQQSEEEEAVAEEGDQEVVKMSENWGSSTTEKCCKCKSGSIGWSSSGRCSFCHGSVSKTASVAAECTKKSPKFMGNSMCAKACRNQVESSWSWLQQLLAEEEEAVAEESDKDRLGGGP